MRAWKIGGWNEEIGLKFSIKKMKRGQQEIVGFALIVVVVIIALMILLIFSLRTPTPEKDSVDVQNLISSVMIYTTQCSVSHIEYENVKSLIKSSYQRRNCVNLGTSAGEELNKTLENIMQRVLESEGALKGFELNIYEQENKEKTADLLVMSGGNCTGAGIVRSSREIIPNIDKKSLVFMVRFCYAA